MDKETRDFYLALNDKAYEVIRNPDYENVLPPDDKTPGSLIHAWGVEMCRVGFNLALALALALFEGGSENEDKAD